MNACRRAGQNVSDASNDLLCVSRRYRAPMEVTPDRLGTVLNFWLISGTPFVLPTEGNRPEVLCQRAKGGRWEEQQRTDNYYRA